MAKKKTKNGLLGLGAASLLVLGKLKFLVVVLKFVKLSSLLSLVLSFGLYAALYGWQFAVALMYVLILHEAGHIIVATQRGVPTSPVFFIPFVGATAGIKGGFRHARDETAIAFGGPLLGTLATALALLLYDWSINPIWLLAVYFGAMINLLNLIPISPLDGGRIVTAISPKIWFVGLVVLAVYLIFFPNALLVLILLLGFLQIIGLLREPFAGRLLGAYVRLLERRARQLAVYEQSSDDLYSRNLLVYDDKQRMQRLMNRCEYLKKDRTLSRVYRKVRLYLFDKQISILTNTPIDETPDSLKWLEGESRRVRQKQRQLKNYYRTSAAEKITTGALYLILLVCLAALLYMSMRLLPAVNY
ncbi:MAG: site-2 protease family protein [Sporolactobacillus sp.]